LFFQFLFIFVDLDRRINAMRARDKKLALALLHEESLISFTPDDSSNNKDEKEEEERLLLPNPKEGDYSNLE